MSFVELGNFTVSAAAAAGTAAIIITVVHGDVPILNNIHCANFCMACSGWPWSVDFDLGTAERFFTT